MSAAKLAGAPGFMLARATRRARSAAAVCAVAIALGALPFAPAMAAVFCVATPAQFSAALALAGENGEDDAIRVRAGTYTVPTGGFIYSSVQPFDLELSGRWNPSCTSTRSQAPSYLDGGGSQEILSMLLGGGAVAVRRLVFLNGYSADVSIGAGALAINPGLEVDIDITIELNQFLFNSAAPDGGTNVLLAGALAAATAGGTLSVRNNLFANNTGTFASAAALRIQGSSAAYITSNTVVLNGSPAATAASAFRLLNALGEGSYAISNNIFWDNDGVDLHFHDGGSILLHNDIGVLVGVPDPASTGNVSVDPGFSANGSLHLEPSSPLIDIGLNAVPGGLSATDLDGRQRIIGGAVDLGAYELPDRIFLGRFE